MGGHDDIPYEGDDSNSGMNPPLPQEEEVRVKIRPVTGCSFSVEVKLESTVRALKTIIARECGIPVHEQRIIFNGRFLTDDQTLYRCGLAADHTVHLIPSTHHRSAVRRAVSAAMGEAGRSHPHRSTIDHGLSSNIVSGAARPRFERYQPSQTPNRGRWRNDHSNPEMINFIPNDPIAGSHQQYGATASHHYQLTGWETMAHAMDPNLYPASFHSSNMGSRRGCVVSNEWVRGGLVHGYGVLLGRLEELINYPEDDELHIRALHSIAEDAMTLLEFILAVESIIRGH